MNVPGDVEHFVPVRWEILESGGFIIYVVVVIIFSNNLLIYLWMDLEETGEL